MDPLVSRDLNLVAERFRRFELYRGLMVGWGVTALIGAVILLACWLAGWSPRNLVAILTGLSVLVALVALWRSRQIGRDPLKIARQIEKGYPELDARLLAAIEQHPSLETGQLGYLQREVVQQTHQHSRRHPWIRLISDERMTGVRRKSMVSLLTVVVVLAAITAMPPPRSGSQPRFAIFDRVGSGSEGIEYQITVHPGDTSVERGSELLVMARFDGPLPGEVHVGFGANPASLRRLLLPASLDDPLFGSRIPAITDDIIYRIEYADQRTRDYTVTVFDYPELLRADMMVTFPEYTGLEETTTCDTRRVSAVEGSLVTLYCHLNVPVTSAQLVSKDDEVIVLRADEAQQCVYVTSIPITKNRRYELRLTDAEGRTNQRDVDFVIDAIPNRPPQLKLKFPGRDMQVSPIEELFLQASVWDDFGQSSFGLIHSISGKEPQNLLLGESVPAKQKHQIDHLLDFESFSAKPDELLSYYFWAEDIGPNGKKRRVYSDMFFAEVRHFDEIYRQGQQPPSSSSSSQQGDQASKLAELQKQIVIGTWKLIRRETGPEPTKKFAGDVTVLQESQATALQRVEEFESKTTNAETLSLLETVKTAMSGALEKLSKVLDADSPSVLPSALVSEQSAYQALLKLRAREHRVVQGQPGAGRGQGSSSRSNEQLQQLKLDDARNRYETRSTAADANRNQADREDDQILSRLRELARRQQDINKLLKELEIALKEAEDEEKKEELRRELKRLREEQRELMRDLDEMKGRMERPENQSRMAEANRKLGETRSRVRRASEALEKGMVSRALTEGTRAQRELEGLRDDFRKRSASRFSDDMRQMREDARQLSETEKELAEKIDEIAKPKQRSLRDGPDRKQVAEEFQQQKQKLEDILDQMRHVSQESENAEPLLSKQLYDTLRKTQQRKPGQSLDLTGELVRRGFLPEAGQIEKRAREAIDDLHEGVEEAAKSVLGDEVEALKRAQEQLQKLSQQLGEEIAQADPSEQNEKSASDSKQGSGEKPSDSQNQGSNQQNSASPEAGSRSGSQNADGNRPSPGLRNGSGPSRPNRNQNGDRREGLDSIFEAGLPGGPGGPITGSDFRQWSDRLRDVEEMLGDPKLKTDVARIRDRARSMRVEFRRHSKEPNWSLVRKLVAKPLLELQDRIAEQLARRQSKDSRVPIDRDPVPRRYSEMVRKYYERLGSGK